MVELAIYNSIGQRITKLISAYHEPGKYICNWDASNYSSGQYYAVLKFNNKVLTKSLILIK